MENINNSNENFGSKDFGELLQEFMDMLEKNREHPPVVILDGKIGFPEHASNYWIDLGIIKTEIDLLRWECHLITKNWMTKDLLGVFILEVCNYRGWPLL